MTGIKGNFKKYEAPPEEHLLQTGDTAVLNVENSHGNVEVCSWDRPEVHVITEKSVRARDEREAQELLEAISAEVKQNGNKVEVRTRYPSWKWKLWQGWRSASVNYEVSAPRKTSASLKNRHGNISASQLSGELQADAHHGNLEVADIQGNVVVSNEHGNIKVERVQGDKLQIRERHGNVELTETQGDLGVSSEHGNILLSQIWGNTTVHNDHGQVKMKGVKGDITLTKSHGDLYTSEAEGNFDVSIHHGNMRAEVVPRAEGKCSATAHHGNLAISLPPELQAKIHASSEHGHINPDFPGSWLKERHKQELRAVVNEGGVNIELSTHHGNIEIRRH